MPAVEKSGDIRLKPEALYRACPAQELPFTSTEDLVDGGGLFGQTRAEDAIRFAIEMKQDGHNLFVMGPPGTGRRRYLRHFLDDVAPTEPTPSDWCYVNAFDEPQCPAALELPAGAGKRFARDVETFIREAEAAIGAAFASDDYRARRDSIEREFQAQQGEVFEKVQAAARERNIRIMQTPNGMMFAPIENGEVIGPDEFAKLSSERQQEIQHAVEEVGTLFQGSMRDLPDRLRASRQRIADLDKQVAALAIERLSNEITKTWHAVAPVAEWLASLLADLTENYALLHQTEPGAGGQPPPLPFALADDDSESPVARRYGVNVLVAHDPNAGAPVVFEQRPAYGRLVGRIEHRARFGALLTNFQLVRGGALHEANGGYLVLSAERLVGEPFAWEALKECLRTRAVRIVPLEQMYAGVSTASLEPAPIPLRIKIVLVGSPRLYYLLSDLDPEFDDYFKVVAEFDDRVERTPEVVLRFAQLIAGAARDDGLLPMHRDAVARVIEESARDAEDSERLSTEIRRANDLVREACHWALKRKVARIEREDVEQAIAQRGHRKGRLRQRVLEEILRETMTVATVGERVGQINGLAVLARHDLAFGRPTRITARISLGSGRIIDIEREAELGGALHTKGMMILNGYINATYAAAAPPSFAATLTFEQSYGGVDGDSASSTELYALLSALADVPIRQALAVTGSVDQFGEVQAIGGVNHKIEGFFDICDARGLSGEQGVLIPRANVKHLMLRPRVIAAVAAGKFHIYAVEHIDQGLEILTGVAAGSADADGEFPPGSIHRRVRDRLATFAQQRRAFMSSHDKDDGDE